jgi:hypothetical protein
MLSPLPRRSGWATLAHSAQPYQPSPKGLSGRPAHRPFRGLLGVHSRYGLHTRAVTIFRDTLTEGFSHFVTSIAAPVASGWSDCRVGFAPTGERRLCTARTHSSQSVPALAAANAVWKYRQSPSSNALGQGRTAPLLRFISQTRAHARGMQPRRPALCARLSRLNEREEAGVDLILVRGREAVRRAGVVDFLGARDEPGRSSPSL